MSQLEVPQGRSRSKSAPHKDKPAPPRHRSEPNKGEIPSWALNPLALADNQNLSAFDEAARENDQFADALSRSRSRSRGDSVSRGSTSSEPRDSDVFIRGRGPGLSSVSEVGSPPSSPKGKKGARGSQRASEKKMPQATVELRFSGEHFPKTESLIAVAIQLPGGSFQDLGRTDQGFGKAPEFQTPIVVPKQPLATLRFTVLDGRRPKAVGFCNAAMKDILTAPYLWEGKLQDPQTGNRLPGGSQVIVRWKDYDPEEKEIDGRVSMNENEYSRSVRSAVEAASLEPGTKCTFCKTVIPGDVQPRQDKKCPTCSKLFKAERMAVVECPCCLTWLEPKLGLAFAQCGVCSHSFDVEPQEPMTPGGSHYRGASGVVWLQDNLKSDVSSHVSGIMSHIAARRPSSPRGYCNWSHNIVTDFQIQYPTDDAEILEVIKRATETKHSVRVVGNRHSLAPVVAEAVETKVILISLASYNTEDDMSWGAEAENSAIRTITVNAGASLAAFCAVAHSKGYFLETQTAGNKFSVGGVMLNSVHGANSRASLLNDSVVGVRIIMANGEICQVTAEPELRLLRGSMGAFGVVTHLTIAVHRRTHTHHAHFDGELKLTKETAAQTFLLDRGGYPTQEYFWDPGTGKFLVLRWGSENLPFARGHGRPPSELPMNGEGFKLLCVDPSSKEVTRQMWHGWVQHLLQQNSEGRNDQFYLKGGIFRCIFMSYFLPVTTGDDVFLILDTLCKTINACVSFYKWEGPLEWRFVRSSSRSLWSPIYDPTNSTEAANNPLFLSIDILVRNADLDVTFPATGPISQKTRGMQEFFYRVEQACLSLGGKPHLAKLYGLYPMPDGRFVAFHPTVAGGIYSRQQKEALQERLALWDPHGLFSRRIHRSLTNFMIPTLIPQLTQNPLAVPITNRASSVGGPNIVIRVSGVREPVSAIKGEGKYLALEVSDGKESRSATPRQSPRQSPRQTPRGSQLQPVEAEELKGNPEKLLQILEDLHSAKDGRCMVWFVALLSVVFLPIVFIQIAFGLLKVLLLWGPVLLLRCCQSRSSTSTQVLRTVAGAIGYCDCLLFDLPQICRRHGMRILWKLYVLRPVMHWWSRMFATNFCFFSQRVTQVFIPIRMPFCENWFEEYVDGWVCARDVSEGSRKLVTPSQFITTRGRWVEVYKDSSHVTLGKVTMFSTEGFETEFENCCFGNVTSRCTLGAVTYLKINLVYSSNPWSRARVIWILEQLNTQSRHLEAVFTLKKQLPPQQVSPFAALEQLKRDRPLTPAALTINVPPQDAVFPIGVDDPRDETVGWFRTIIYVFMRVLLFFVLTIPVFLISLALTLVYTFWAFARWLCAKLCCCFCRSRKPKLTEFPEVLTIKPKDVPWDIEYKFFMWAGPVYCWNIAINVGRAYARWITGYYSRVIPIGDETLRRLMANSAVTHHLGHDRRHASGDYYLELGGMHAQKWFAGYEFSCVGARCDTRGLVKEIFMSDKSVHKPDDKTWQLAKMHLAAGIGAASAMLFHSWVHFVLPDLAAIGLYNDVKKNSVLGKLLYPHLRFAMRINQVRNDGLPIQNKQGCLNKLNPIWSFPVSTHDFLSANDAFTNRFYYAEARKPEAEATPFVDVDRTAALKKFIDSGFFPDGRLERLDNFEPPYHAQTSFTNYHKFLGGYYVCIRQFVASVAPDIEVDMYKRFVAGIAARLPEIVHVDMVDVLSLIIWQVSVLHSCDHYTFGAYSRYYCNSPRAFDASMTASDDIHDAFRPWDVIRTRVFNSVFTDPWHHPFIELRLCKVDHKFKSRHLIDSDQQFRDSLVAIDKRMQVHNIQLVPLEEIQVGLAH